MTRFQEEKGLQKGLQKGRKVRGPMQRGAADEKAVWKRAWSRIQLIPRENNS
jgi:hypothetical protein